MSVLLSTLDVNLHWLFDFGYDRIRWPGCRPRDLSHGPASPQKVFTAYPAAIAIVENRIHSSKLDHVRSAIVMFDCIQIARSMPCTAKTKSRDFTLAI